MIRMLGGGPVSLDPNPGTATVCFYAFAGALEVVAPTWVLQVNLPSDTSVHPFQDCVMVTPETAGTFTVSGTAMGMATAVDVTVD